MEFHPGRYAVGYRVLYAFDVSRTWRTTRPYEKPFTPDLGGRPLRVSVWYPAVKGAAAPMRVIDYIHRDAPPAFREMNDDLERRDRRVLAEMVPDGSFDAFLRTGMHARFAATSTPGRFPLLLYCGGVNSFTMSNAIMAELLASHGYVVAAVPSIGESDQRPEQNYTPLEIQTTERDLEFAWSLLRSAPNVDPARLGTFGHSLGGTVAMLFALHNNNVSAVAGLDGTYGFASRADAATLTNDPSYAIDAMRAAILDIHRAPTNLDLAGVEAFRYADRTFTQIPLTLHSDFTTFVVVARAFNLPPPDHVPEGYTRQTGFVGFTAAFTLVRNFFDRRLKGSTDPIPPISGITLRHEDASPAPPTVSELLAMLESRGFDATVRVVDAEQPIVIDEPALNAAGYALIAQKKTAEAIDVLRLVVHVNPRSANAEDSLGDAYLAAGDRERARAAFAQAITLAADDSALDATAKASFAQAERAKLARLAQ